MSNFQENEILNNLPEESSEKNRVVGGTLYLVATPVGNLADLSSRAIKVLSEVDFIAAEDTRNSMRLLRYLGISKPMVSYFEHNKRTHGDMICEKLLSGESCALITDAGTPAISDPGEDIVALCAEKNIPVSSIPGPCAAILALTLSGLPTGRFTFEGFLPMNKKNRKAQLAALKTEERTMLFYEAPHKLVPTLRDLAATFGEARRIALCRELTKLHEEIRRTTLGEAVAWYEENMPRGEFVLVVEGAAPQIQESDPDRALDRVMELREEGLSLKAACKQAGEEFGIPKNQLYDMAVNAED